MNDLATALTASVAKDGQTTMTGNLPMGTNKLTGLGAGSAATDSANLGQVAAQAYIWCSTATGTANALLLSPSPAITAYAAGQVFRFKSSASANTAATTVAVSGLTATAIQNQGTALAGGEIEASKWYQVLYDGAAFQLMALQPAYTTDATPIVNGSSDASKKLRFEVDGFTTATTRVLTPPNADGTILTVEGLQSSISVQNAQSANYTVIASDYADVITCTGSFTLTLTAAATLGAGFWFWVNNVGTGTITIDPNASETVRVPGGPQTAGTTFTLPYSGSTSGPYNVSGVLLWCDGSNWAVLATNETHGSETFTSNGTWTAPAGVTTAFISGCGGGGGGGGHTGSSAGAGGGGAASAVLFRAACVPGTAYTVTIGALGGGGAQGGGTGGAGTASSVGALLTLNGGAGGTSGVAGAGGTGSAPQAPGAAGAGNAHCNGGGSLFGGGGNPPGGGAGNPGGGYGAGGSGSLHTSSAPGGAGTAGIIIVSW
jgi:hypothetical protein